VKSKTARALAKSCAKQTRTSVYTSEFEFCRHVEVKHCWSTDKEKHLVIIC